MFLRWIVEDVNFLTYCEGRRKLIKFQQFCAASSDKSSGEKEKRRNFNLMSCQQSFKLFIHLRLMRWVQEKFFFILMSSSEPLKIQKSIFLFFYVSPSFLFSFCLLEFLLLSLHQFIPKNNDVVFSPCGIDGWTELKHRNSRTTNIWTFWIVNQSKITRISFLTSTWAWLSWKMSLNKFKIWNEVKTSRFLHSTLSERW